MVSTCGRTTHPFTKEHYVNWPSKAKPPKPILGFKDELHTSLAWGS